ncbi:MAG: OsmC family peroxiredoxin [Rhodobacteraceae bacterium]|nr:MAG: OsmC family peroxiredoxin [Paracoccaceae bacterium]
MSTHISTRYVPISGTAAGLGLTAGGGTLVADRPRGKARGQGLGHNGADLLSAALGGCFWNDLHYVADAAKVGIGIDSVEAEIELAGNPPRVVRAHIRARLSGAPEDVLQQVFDAAAESSTIANSLTGAFETLFERLV